jgi:hypothetical protein
MCPQLLKTNGQNPLRNSKTAGSLWISETAFSKGQLSERLHTDKVLFENSVNNSKTIPVPAVGQTASVNAVIYVCNERFDDVTPGLICGCFDYSITVGDIVFKIRNYFDKPGESTVISPTAARQSPRARQLVDYLASVIGCQRVYFYDGRSDMYREVDLQTLEFDTYENASPDTALEPTPDRVSSCGFTVADCLR